MLRWARENGCEWDAETRHRAAAELGYTDDLGNLVEEWSDDEYSDDANAWWRPFAVAVLPFALASATAQVVGWIMMWRMDGSAGTINT